MTPRRTATPPPRAGRRSYVAAALFLGAALAGLGWRHYDQLRHGHVDNISAIAAISFVYLAIMITLAHSHRDVIIPATDLQQAALDAMCVVVVAPTYNENPAMFAAMLDSLGRQTRLPQYLIVVDDGSSSTECRDEFDLWYRCRRPEALEAEYLFQDNAGKREAQARAFRRVPHADIYVTMDSDVTLDRHAIEYGLMPFTRKRTMSVAGMLIGLNHRQNLLTRLIELGFVSSFLNGRAQNSAMGSVTVNAGGFALYRGSVIQDRLAHYLRQTVLGRKVSSGDDAMLTRYALQRGRTVFQRAAFGYTLHPVNFRHLTKQRIRWARSFWWGGVWLIRNFSCRRYAWWLVAWDFVAAAWMTVVMPVVFLITPLRIGRLSWGLLGILALLSYTSSTRFLSVRRKDESYLSQLFTFSLAPLCSLLQIYLGWALTYVGLFTFAKTGWGTRKIVEVGIETN